MKIEVINTEVKQKTVRSKEGKEYTFYTQEAFFHDPSAPYPTRMLVPVDSLSAAYSAGFYALGPRSLYVDRFGNLALARRYSLLPL